MSQNKILSSNGYIIKSNPQTLKDYKSGKLGRTIPGSLPFGPKKPTLIFQKNALQDNALPPPIRSNYKANDDKYYLTPLVKNNSIKKYG